MKSILKKIKENWVLCIAIIVAIIILIIGVLLAMNKKNSDDGTGDTTHVTSTSNPIETPIISTVAEQSDMTGIDEPDNNMFENNKVLTARDDNGTLSVGLNSSNAKDNSIGLILNPSYSLASDSRKIGYYIQTESLRIIKTSSEAYKPENDTSLSNNVFVDWTYDKCIPAQYEDENNYGVCWYMNMNNPNVTEDTVQIIVMDMNTHNFLGVYKARIARNASGRFELQELWNDSLLYTTKDKLKELWIGERYSIDAMTNEEIYEDLRGCAIQQIKEGEFIIDENLINTNVIVELVNKTYHPKFFTYEQQTGYSGNVPYPVWAVTVNVRNSDIGHITFYYSDTAFHFFGYDFTDLKNTESLEKAK